MNELSCGRTNTRDREFGLDKLEPSVAADLSGNLVTTMQAGAVAGALLSSPFADRKGRKPALFGVAITGFIGGVMQAVSFGHLPVFYVGRHVVLQRKEEVKSLFC
jgi:MFS family permease